MGTALTTSARDTETIGVVELGTNSLKLHLHTDGGERCEPSRVEWDVGHQIDSTRGISKETIDGTMEQIGRLLRDHRADPSLDPIFSIATGAFRHAENTSALLDRLFRELGIPGRILTAEQEASLLAEGAGWKIRERPWMVFDLGGGALELVHMGANGTLLREDFPLGAIHIYRLGSLSRGVWDHHEAERRIVHTLQKARSFQLPTIHGTGGTVKAITQVAGRQEVLAEGVRELEERTRTEGPPRGLS
ncbi:MAG: Ppx/GppA phosphatase family protein, partial [Thermoanaerobaculia bacterium]